MVLAGPSPILAEGAGCGSPQLLAGVRQLCWWWWVVSWGLDWGFPVLCVFVARAIARGAHAFVCFMCLWCLCWWWCGVGLSSACRSCGWCLCGCGWCVLWVVPCHSWLRVLGAFPLPLLAWVRWWWSWLVPRHSWLRVLFAVPRHFWLGSGAGSGGWSLATPGWGLWVRFPATPAWGPLVVVVRVASLLLAEGPGGCSPSSFPGRGLLVAVAWQCCARVLVCCVVVARPSPSPWPLCVCVCVRWCLLLVRMVCGARVRRVCGLCVCVCMRFVVFGVCHTWFGSRCQPKWSRLKAEKEVL